MANHPSAAKRNRQNILRNARNSALRSRMRKALREATQAVATNATDKDTLVKHAVTIVYQTASKGVIRAGNASRHVSRLMKAAHR